MKIRVFLLSAVSIPAMTPHGAFAAQAGSSADRDIVVTASALEQKADETATPVITLSDDELVHRRQATLGDTLAGQPGINFDNFGGGASRPVIRGQTAPRVQSLSDGSNIQDASAISPDHAVTTEPLLLRGIEVLRGPAALLYGGGAIGGAINLLDDKVPTAIPEDGISGVAEGRLGTADKERSLVGGLTAGVGPFAFHVEGVDRSSDDYRVPKKFGEPHVDGSYNDTSTFSVGGSWIGDGGYLGVAYTRQRSEYGLPGHAHEYEDCHPHGSSLHCRGHGHDDDDHDHDHEHDHDEVPFVKLRSERFDIRSEYRDPLPGFEKVRLRMSFTDYEHDEIEADEVATTFKNKAHDIRFELAHKTTVLNRLVCDPAMSRALVVINECGAVGLDHDLVTRSTEDLVVEMMGGCLCCTIRGDLVRTLRDAPFRFARDGKCWFDRLVIETTGLADPAPILHTLMTDDHLQSLYRLDGVITTVDAVTGMATLDAQEESVKQAAVADRLLLSKTDMASELDIRALEARLRTLNPAAPIFHVIDGLVDAKHLFDAGIYNPETKSNDVQRWLNAEAYESDHHHAHEHGHEHGHAHEHGQHHDVNRHDDRIRAICLTFDAPLKDTAFDRWIGILTTFKGPDVLRIKGIVNIEGLDRPLVIHGVQHVLHTPVALDAWPSEDRRTRMVFIVRDMDEADLRGTLALMTIGLENVFLQGAGGIDLEPAPGLIPDRDDAPFIGGYEVQPGQTR